MGGEGGAFSPPPGQWVSAEDPVNAGLMFATNTQNIPVQLQSFGFQNGTYAASQVAYE